MGPLAQARRVAVIAGFIEDANQRGATIPANGKRARARLDLRQAGIDSVRS